ncbi:alpha/beta hydrolase [Fusobacterium ulcerans]|uniref:alpha/beta hydrolase n=1 Tax=Fusobacterium ulcerans TaxID=861 RepID=UPI001032D4B0|nr:alpha/beta hydrolase [Fusobacterium ulcerans]
MEEKILRPIEDYKAELEALNFICNNYEAKSKKAGDKKSVQNLADAEGIQKRVMKIGENVLQNIKIHLEEELFLTDEEKELLDKCKKALDTEVPIFPPSDGIITGTVFGIGKLINLVSYLYERYQISRNDKELLKFIEEKGLEVMANYPASIIADIIESAVTYAIPDSKMIELVLKELEKAKDLGNKYRKETENFTIEYAKRLLRVAKYAYSGIKENNKYLISPMRKIELPDAIGGMESYNQSTGMLEIPGSMKVIFGKLEKDIVIGFAGTEITSKLSTLGTDIQQILSPNLMYLRAAGIVSIMRSYYPKEQKIIVAGHSLGGGLAQAAIVSNIRNENVLEDNLLGAVYNSAGLSLVTLLIASEDERRIEQASKNITHYRAPLDPVSAFGALIGTVKELEGASVPYHCISNIKNSFI